ncbi:ABC transporter substrate-binding protein [Aquabacterium humicola]|uniref:ABC transporter substrate-binding protein n=1 Tax=Aquabacterium humicola TaxID=3237377 RepID=UPI00254375D0|nr:NrtA/SsuA/CpmA family ABC transporter substrate-binding protein [Rubrivivax pictus]
MPSFLRSLPVLLLLLAGLTGRAAAADVPPLTLAVSRGSVSMLVYVAEARRYFADEGVDLRTVNCTSGRACLGLVGDGLADLGTAAELAVVLAGGGVAGARPDLAIVGSISTSPNQLKLIARRSAGITQAADLADKRIGTVGGTSAQYFLVSWLQHHGIAGARLQFMAPEQLSAALHAGVVDAIAIWEPIATLAQRELRGDAVELPGAGVYTQHFVLAGAQRVLRDKEEALQRLMRALLRAQQYVADEPAKAAQILATRLGMQPADAARFVNDHDYRLRLDATLLPTMSAQARWAVREGLLPAEAAVLSPARFVDARLLARLAPSAVAR